MKSLGIANYISLARIILSILLLVIQPLSTLFILSYLLCGVTDLFDGYIARKTQTASELGSKLDSIADFIMVVVIMLVLIPVIPLNRTIIVWVLIIALIKIISIVIVVIKHRTFEIIHTFSNKMVGIILFLYPLTLSITDWNGIPYIICVVASLAAVEEVWINLLTNELSPNRRSIFIK